MSIVVNTNVSSLNAQRSLSVNTSNLNKSLEKLSSGFRINKAADDAAGLQISEGLRAQIRGVGQAVNNAQDGMNLLSVAEGTLSVVQDNLQRIRELTVQAANDTNGESQRDAIKQEIEARISDIDRMTKATSFNGTKLLSASSPSEFKLQVGANDVASLDTIDIASAGLGDATFSAISSGASVDISTNSKAMAFLSAVDTALENVSSRRANIGAVQNQLESTISNLNITKENFEAAESRIRNVDVAKEAANLTKSQILQQASASILAQANQTPSLALSLIRG